MDFVIKKQVVFILTVNNDYRKMRMITEQKMNRQREGYCITEKDATCNISDRKSLLNEFLFSIEDSLRYNKPQQKTTLFCFGSFVFS